MVSTMAASNEDAKAENNYIEHATIDHKFTVPIKLQEQALELERVAYEGRKIDLRTAMGAIVSIYGHSMLQS
jgi:hypothetical protein